MLCLAVWLAGISGVAASDVHLAGGDGYRYTVTERGLSRVERNGVTLGSGALHAVGHDAQLRADEAAPWTGSPQRTVERIDERAARVVHRYPHVTAEHVFRVDRGDVTVEARIHNRHGEAAIERPAFDGFDVQWRSPPRGWLPAVKWNTAYLREMDNAWSPSGRYPLGTHFGMTDRLGVAVAPRIEAIDGEPVTHVAMLTPHGAEANARAWHVYAAFKRTIPPGERARIGLTLRFSHEPTVSRMLAPYMRTYADAMGVEAMRADLRGWVPSADVGMLPSYRKARVHLAGPAKLQRMLGDDFDATPRAAELTLTRVDQPSRPLASTRIEIRGKSRGVRVVDIPELDPGEHRLSVRLIDSGFDYVFPYTWKDMAWMGNELGITDEVLPPFEPIRVDPERGEVSVVQRRYTLSDLGLPTAIESVGESILAKPVTLVANGEPVSVGEGRFVQTQAHEAVYRAIARRPAVTLINRAIVEYDGCIRYELTLSPGLADGELRSLHLDIPLRDAAAPLWHVVGHRLRENPAGLTPAGEGRVWDSNTPLPGGTIQWKKDNWNNSFLPYIWLGGELRGLAWFADNDRGWVPERVSRDNPMPAPGLELFRDNGTLTLRINFVQKPVRIEEPRTIVFGLMASPAKPMRDDWRNIVRNPGTDTHQSYYWIPAQYWGSDASFAARYPRGGGYEILEAIGKSIRHRDLGYMRAIDPWMEKHAAGDLSDTSAKSREQIRKLLEVCFTHTRKAHVVSAYWEELAYVWRLHPEVEPFEHEWSQRFPSQLDKRFYLPIWGVIRSYHDFGCWAGAPFIRNGIGLYIDNVFLRSEKDTITTQAYRLPDGRIQPSTRLWSIRDYFKRLWVMHQTLAPDKPEPIMYTHMTNAHLLPILSFSEANLDLEWRYDQFPVQTRFSPAMLRAQSIGRQSGNFPDALNRLDEGRLKRMPEARQRRERRARFGMHMVHEIRGYFPRTQLDRKMYRFGYGLDHTTVYNYWQDDYPLAIDDPKCKSIAVHREDGQTLVLLCTWNKQHATLTLELDTRLRPGGEMRVIDHETNEVIPGDNGRYRVAMPGYGVRLLRFEPAPPADP